MTKTEIRTMSQSPQIGSSVQSQSLSGLSFMWVICRNPLKSGQAFKGRRSAMVRVRGILSQSPQIGSSVQSGSGPCGKPCGRASQSPQIGSSVQSRGAGAVGGEPPRVAIPSNRVKRSKANAVIQQHNYIKLSQSPQIGSSVQSIPPGGWRRGAMMSQSPQIGSSVQSQAAHPDLELPPPRRNPLKSGQAFKGQMPNCIETGWYFCRNPLKSGQAFTVSEGVTIGRARERRSQSPQIGSSVQSWSEWTFDGAVRASQSPQIGSSVQSGGGPVVETIETYVAIPSNRVKRSKRYRKLESKRR